MNNTNNASISESNNDGTINDEAAVLPVVVSERESLFESGHWRLPSEYQLFLLSDIKLLNSTKIDKITQFSLRPPELTFLFDKVGEYYRWFDVGTLCVKNDVVSELISVDLHSSVWIDSLQCQVKLRKNAFSEVARWLDEIEDEENIGASMFSVFRRIFSVYGRNIAELSESDRNFFEFAQKNLVFDDGDRHLPIPVYSFMKPTMGPQFLHHVLLSMGRFQTELDLILQPSIRKSFEVARLIGDLDDPDSLEEYSDALLNQFIRKQLCFYPNGQGTIDSWIVHTGELFDGVIIRDEIPISEMPPVLMSALFAEKLTNTY